MIESRSIHDWTRDIVLVEIAKSQARAGDIAGAETTASRISDPDWAALAADPIAVRAAVNDGNSPLWTRVRRWLGMKTRTADTVAVSMALSDLGRWDEAIRVAETIGDPARKSFALRSACIARARGGDFQGAMAMADTQALRDSRPFTLLAIASAENKRKRPAGAIAAVDRALASPPYEPYTQGMVLTWAARERTLAGDRKGALKILSGGLNSASAIPDAAARARSISDLLGEYARAGQVTRALSLTQSILRPSDRNWAYRTIAIACADNGDPAAIDVSLRITDPTRRDHALRGVAMCLARRRHFDEAARAERSILDPYKRQLSGRFICTELARAGRIREARDRRAQMLPDTERAHAWQEVCRILAASGSSEEAMAEARTGPTPYDRALGYVGSAQGSMDRAGKDFPDLENRED
jgi:tetratricopeptide (TPR) repeat protein